MATSPASLTSWKLKETVKFMRLNASKKGDSQTQAFVRKDAATKKQEIKVCHKYVAMSLNKVHLYSGSIIRPSWHVSESVHLCEELVSRVL